MYGLAVETNCYKKRGSLTMSYKFGSIIRINSNQFVPGICIQLFLP